MIFTLYFFIPYFLCMGAGLFVVIVGLLGLLIKRKTSSILRRIISIIVLVIGVALIVVPGIRIVQTLAGISAANTEVEQREETLADSVSYAVYQGDEEKVALLLSEGADPNEYATFFEHEGSTPIMICASSTGPGPGAKTQRMIELLVEYGADVNAQNATSGECALSMAARVPMFTSIVEQLISLGADINLASNDGRTPLICATQNKNATCIDFLIDAGADVNDIDEQGRSALWYAVDSIQLYDDEDYLEIAEALVTAGADFNLSDNDGVSIIGMVDGMDHTSTSYRTLMELFA